MYIMKITSTKTSYLKSSVILLGLLAGEASAVTLSHFSRALAYGHPDHTSIQADDFFNNTINTGLTPSSSSGQFSVPLATAAATASANLATGSLKVYSSATDRAQAGGFVEFGDSFQFTDNSGGAFNWTGSDEATFHIDLSGGVTQSGININNSISSIAIRIFQPGGLDAYIQDSYYTDEDSQTYEWIDMIIADQSYQLDSPEYVQWLYDTFPDKYPQGSIQHITDFPSSIDFSFMPEGDFDWQVQLSSYVDSSEGGTVTADFSNTAVVSFTGPAGSQTLSSSGVFPNTSIIPEPSSSFMLGVSLLSLVFSRSRR